MVTDKDVSTITELGVSRSYHEGEMTEDLQKTDARIYDKAAERRLCRKLDMRILPFIAVSYLFCALDKGNISNAKTDGLDKDLGMSASQWNIMLSIFYIPFVLFAFPITFIIKKYNAANVIPILMMCFGGLSLIATGVTNFGGIMAVRFLLGISESAFFPGIIYYLSTFYRRTELARRLSVFYAAANIANAFSGLLAFGVFQIKSHLHGWQYLFLIEGACTVIFAAIAFLCLPRSPAEAKFLSQEEKDLAFYRIQTDSSAVVGEKINFKDTVKVFLHPVTIGWLFQELCLGVPLNSINNWFPQIVASLGKGTVQTNLYTVAPNVSGAVCLLILAFASDYARLRSVFIMTAFFLSLMGFAVFGAIDTQKHVGVAYFSCFLMTAGGSASSVLTSTWYNNNTPGETRRAVLSAVGIPLANAAGLISANIFIDPPKYVTALGITAGFGGLGLIICACITLYMIFDNRRRNRLQGVKLTYQDVSTAVLADGPKNPQFRWMY
ncbi:Tna1p [Sugiyamaella lignohabitans]|uniref:Tna1p n=1 Tax=Sugiyamaella lignohabitans TaxID=796027 RepID=A0A167CGH8_9ASCO|nr:Tna1p [Sugiyamaella lignohabitans]ANB11656.1 Tna1p [Sugiyamaella lignohabitans]